MPAYEKVVAKAEISDAEMQALLQSTRYTEKEIRDMINACGGVSGLHPCTPPSLHPASLNAPRLQS